MGLLILVAMALVSAVTWHRLVSRYWSATLFSTVTTLVTFQLGAFLHAGHLDSLFGIALVTSSFCALVVSALVGLPIRSRRRRGELA
jgi:uncharacterized membrane protein YfcA